MSTLRVNLTMVDINVHPTGNFDNGGHKWVILIVGWTFMSTIGAEGIPVWIAVGSNLGHDVTHPARIGVSGF